MKNTDPDHGESCPNANHEAAAAAEIARLEARCKELVKALEQCRDALQPMQHEYTTSEGEVIACGVTCAYAAAVDALGF